MTRPLASNALVERIAAAFHTLVRGWYFDPAGDARARATMSFSGRRWISSDGRQNMPSGEVYSAPVDGSADGWVAFDHASRFEATEVTGLRLEFSGGEIVSVEAERGADFVRSVIARDPGAARLGELGIGLNPYVPAATGVTLLDEKIDGTIHLALGDSAAAVGGTNRSDIHWDLVTSCAGVATVEVDGRTVDLWAL